MSILIVEDDETSYSNITRILQESGYRKMLKASSAQEMFQLLGLDDRATPTSISINLILIDISIHDMDGIEATKRIVQEERYKDIPIIFIAAMGDTQKLAKALDAGITDYVMRPINKIELLARIRFAIKLKFQKDRHKERDQRLNFELEVAKRVQQNILCGPIDDEYVQIEGICKPSFELAGDFYAWYAIDRHRYGIILLDMMGHGISSSLVCMYILSVLEHTIKRFEDPVRVAQELNRYMYQLDLTDELSNYHFTAIYALLDTKEKTLEYVNAGHPPGVIFTDHTEHLLTEGCCALGFFEQIEIKKEKLHYEEQLKLILYTDGLIEARYKDEVTGLEQLTNDLKRHREADFSELVAKLIPHYKNGKQQDDICVVMVATK